MNPMPHAKHERIAAAMRHRNAATLWSREIHRQFGIIPLRLVARWLREIGVLHCGCCGQWLEVAAFSPCLRSRCRECNREYMRRYASPKPRKRKPTVDKTGMDVNQEEIWTTQ